MSEHLTKALDRIPANIADEMPRITKLLAKCVPFTITREELESWHPNYLFNMAYAIYSYEDPDQRWTVWEYLGESAAIRLLSARADILKDEIYLSTVRNIVLSY